MTDPTNEPWYLTERPCPICDERYHAQLSGLVEPNLETTIDAEHVDSVCVEGPTDGDGKTVLYFHMMGDADQ